MNSFDVFVIKGFTVFDKKDIVFDKKTQRHIGKLFIKSTFVLWLLQ